MRSYALSSYPGLAGSPPTTPVRVRRGTGEEDRTIVTFPTPGGRRTGGAIDLVLVVDDSGSTHSTDPREHRYTGAGRLLHWMAYAAYERPRPSSRTGRRRRTGYPDQVGIVHFASKPDPVIPLTPLDRDLERLMRSLHKATDGGTSLVPALDAALRIIPRREPYRTPLTLVFTDGSISEDRATLAHALDRHVPGSVHVVLFDETGTGSDVAHEWSELPFGSVTAIESMATDGIEWTFAKPVVQAMGLIWRSPRTPVNPITGEHRAPVRTQKGQP